MSQRIGNSEPNFLSLAPSFRGGDMNTRWVEKLSPNSVRLGSPSASDGFWDSEPKPLALSTGICDGSFDEKGKKWVGKSFKNRPSVASLSALHENRNEPDPLPLRTESPDGSITEKKKWKNVKKWAGKSPQSSGSVASLSVLNGNKVSKDSAVQISDTKNSLSVGMQSSDDCSMISKQGSAELSSTTVVEDIVVQCSKQVEHETSKNRSYTGSTHNGKENRNFGWNRRQYNAREAHANWGNKPSYRNGVKDINSEEDRFGVVHCSLANDAILRSPMISSGYNNGKENRNFGWNRRQYNAREGHVNWGKKSSYRNGVKDVNPADNRFWTEQNSSANNAVSPNWSYSSGHNNTAYAYRKRFVPPRQLDTSSQGVAPPKRLNVTLFVSVKGQTEGLENDSGNLVERSTDSLKPVNCNVKKSPCSYEANFSEWHAKCVSCHIELSQGCSHVRDCKKDAAGTNGKQTAGHGVRHYSNPTSLYTKLSTQGLMNDIQKHEFRKIPSMEYEFGKSEHASVDGIPFCHTDHKLEKDTSGTNLMQRTAIGTKELRPVDKISSASISNELNLLLDSSRQLNNSHLGGTRISCHRPNSYDDPKIYPSAAKQLSNDAEFRGPKDTEKFLIGSHMGMKNLSDAYQIQLASETVQLAMGCPLAEFETFIHSAAPVICSSCVHDQYSGLLGTHPSQSLLGKPQIPNVSLHSVWNWYEIPGNYGLDVKAICPKTLTGLPRDSMLSRSYFAPSLSAIQLFRPHIPGCKRLFSNSLEAVQLNHICVGSVDVALHDRSCVQSLDWSPVLSSDPELIFEFFEVELPHHRRPFYNKILELIGAGTSNPLVFGDPSKLGTLNLRDLHPASWFSVAWYPIYQIPEGHLHASFLTYHSLGHFVQGPGSTVAQGCITFPVLGLQSYNSRDECWFEPKVPSSEESTSFDTTGILIKRLRTLDENAMHFARGWVYKDKVMVQNRHPDYEFFTSRKARYK
ncbi:uncharacterized protein LOC126800689 [Argentina anserina]|uniref:uncharacterized protein LOC126800689 n=1 Tax=Argentina anserina TaxID=57926 RepID=UPI0021763DC4|nr:uncharacterized protein LOC126800689 [Potentilla anserina]